MGTAFETCTISPLQVLWYVSGIIVTRIAYTIIGRHGLIAKTSLFFIVADRFLNLVHDIKTKKKPKLRSYNTITTTTTTLYTHSGDGKVGVSYVFLDSPLRNCWKREENPPLASLMRARKNALPTVRRTRVPTRVQQEVRALVTVLPGTEHGGENPAKIYPDRS